MWKALCADIHPNGLILSIGFKEGLKTFLINSDQFLEIYENYCKYTKCIKYSTRGDLLATSSQNHIIVYDPYNMHRIKKI